MPCESARLLGVRGNGFAQILKRFDHLPSQSGNPWSQSEEFMKSPGSHKWLCMRRLGITLILPNLNWGIGLSRVLKFGTFELVPSAFELRRGTRVVKVEKLAMGLLLFLVSRRESLVSREEIAAALWGKDVLVDIEDGINTAVRKVRRALGDNAERPRFIQRLPGKGYRFIASVSEEYRHETSNRVLLLAAASLLRLSWQHWLRPAAVAFSGDAPAIGIGAHLPPNHPPMVIDPAGKGLKRSGSLPDRPLFRSLQTNNAVNLVPPSQSPPETVVC